MIQQKERLVGPFLAIGGYYLAAASVAVVVGSRFGWQAAFAVVSGFIAISPILGYFLVLAVGDKPSRWTRRFAGVALVGALGIPMILTEHLEVRVALIVAVGLILSFSKTPKAVEG